MNIKLVLPKNVVPIAPTDKIFFLAGPIMGGGDWQSNAIQLLVQRAPESYIICPCRYAFDHALYRFGIQGDEDAFPSQTLWERHYLALASKQGAILFWLPEESRVNPRPREKGPYARDTYGELGEWRTRMHYDGARVVIGAEPGFPGLSVIVKNFRATIGDQFAPYKTLAATVNAAMALL